MNDEFDGDLDGALDEALDALLASEIPKPAPGYWDDLDETLAEIATERPPTPVEAPTGRLRGPDEEAVTEDRGTGGPSAHPRAVDKPEPTRTPLLVRAAAVIVLLGLVIAALVSLL